MDYADIPPYCTIERREETVSIVRLDFFPIDQSGLRRRGAPIEFFTIGDIEQVRNRKKDQKER